MVLGAAAQKLGVPAAQLTTAGDGKVMHAASNRSLTYGELAADAAKQPVPMLSMVPLKKPADYKIIGKPREGRRHGQHRHRQADLQHRLHAARHAVGRVREGAGVRRQGRRPPTSI